MILKRREHKRNEQLIATSVCGPIEKRAAHGEKTARLDWWRHADPVTSLPSMTRSILSMIELVTVGGQQCVPW
jgi:hypothetical protein